jgi:hypothetical protein
MTMKSGPAFSRVRLTISTGNRMRFAKEPPHSSLRWIRPRRDELVDQVALRAHDLDAVVARALRKLGAADVGGDRSTDSPARQRARLEGRDRRAQRGGCDGEAGGTRSALACRICIAILPPAACTASGDQSCLPTCQPSESCDARGSTRPREIGRDAAGDDQPDTATGALGVERGHPRESVGRLLEARVHRPHQHAIRQRDEAEIERRQQMGIARRGHRPRVRATTGTRRRRP